jgi:hypothetical protein
MFTMTRIDFQPSANEGINRRHEVLIPFTRSNGLPPHPVPLAQAIIRQQSTTWPLAL